MTRRRKPFTNKKKRDRAILSTISLMGRVRAKYLVQYLHQMGLDYCANARDLGKYIVGRGLIIIEKEELRRRGEKEVYYKLKPRYRNAFTPPTRNAMILLYGDNRIYV